jgi:hypothetical protein
MSLAVIASNCDNLTSFFAISYTFLMRYRPLPSDDPHNRNDDLFRARLDKVIRPKTDRDDKWNFVP